MKVYYCYNKQLHDTYLVSHILHGCIGADTKKKKKKVKYRKQIKGQLFGDIIQDGAPTPKPPYATDVHVLGGSSSKGAK